MDNKKIYDYYSWLWQIVKPVKLPMSEGQWDRLVETITEKSQSCEDTDPKFSQFMIDTSNAVLRYLGAIQEEVET